MIEHMESVVGAMIASVVLSGALFYVRSFPGMRPGLGWWGLGFGLNAVRLALYLSGPALGRDVLFFLAETIQAIQSVLLLAGTLAFLGHAMAMPVLAAACLGFTGWAAFGTFVHQSFVVTTIPLYLATGLVLMASGVLLLRMPGEGRRRGRTIAGVSFILWGVHKLDFPFLRTVEAFASWGFMIAQTLALTAALGIIVMALRALQRQGEREVAERLAAEKALNESDALYRTAFRTSPDAINLNRLEDGLYVDTNEGFTELTGYTREDVIGRTSAEIGIWADMADRQRLVAGLKANGQVSNLKAVFRRKDGATTTALMSARVLRIGGVPHILSVTRDISRLQQAEEALQKSEAQLRSIVDAAPIALVLKDLQGRFQMVNKTFLAWHGLTNDTLVGKTCHDVHDPDLAEQVARRDDQTVIEGALPPVEMERVFPDGVKRTVSVLRFPVFDAEHVITGTGGMLTDISGQRRAEEWLRRMSQSVEQSPLGIIITDTQGRIEYINPSFTRETGYVMEDVRGKSASLQNAEGPGSPSDRQIKAAVAADREWRGEVRHRRKNGEVYWASLLISPVLDDGGRAIAYVSISEDITERRKVAEHLRQAQKMEAVGHLTGGIAHDFNNILSVVQLNAEILAEDMQGHAAGGTVARILRAVQRAAELTGRLLAFSRRQDLLPEVVDLGAAVRDTADLLRRSLGETVAVTLDIAPDTPAVTIDRGQFENALLNLAINARDAMPSGGTLTIGVGRGQPAAVIGDGEFVGVTVTDSGTGMPPEVAERIFEPFFTTKSKGHGTGLGLSMVYGFVGQSGGDIEVDTAPGEGTTFRLFFPVAGQIETTRAAGGAKGGDPVGEVPPLVILLAEDDADVRGSTRAILHGRGHAVVQAANGVEALERLKQTPEVDLLLTDVVMPGGMTGRDLAAAAWADRPGLKVLFTSGYAAGMLSADDLEPGRSAFLAKPYTKEGLLGTLSVLWFTACPNGTRRNRRPQRA